MGARTRMARLRDRLSKFGTIRPLAESPGEEAVAGKEAGLGDVIAARAGAWLVMTVNCPDEREAIRKLSAVCERVADDGPAP